MIWVCGHGCIAVRTATSMQLCRSLWLNFTLCYCDVCAPEALQPACCRTIFGIWRVKQDSKGTLEDVLRVRRLVSSSSLLRRLLCYNYIPAYGILLLSTKELGLRWLQNATVDL